MTKKETTAERRIAVLTNGWVFVGEWHGTYMTNASCVRIWGTSKGIGELALNGPTKSTVLDPCGIVHIQPSALLFTHPCGW